VHEHILCENAELFNDQTSEKDNSHCLLKVYEIRGKENKKKTFRW
jgi:hypothetical protein